MLQSSNGNHLTALSTLSPKPPTGKKVMLVFSALAVCSLAVYVYNIPNQDEENKHNNQKREDKNEQKPVKPTRYIGLRNLGNTCYLNSLVQALAGCESYGIYASEIIYNKLITLDKDLDNRQDEDNRLLYKFIYQLLQLYHNYQYSDLKDLYELICSNSSTFRMNEECDAHELNLFIQDKLREVVPNGQLQRSASLSSIFEEEKVTSFCNPLYALYKFTIECQECKKFGCEPIVGQEHHLDININIPKPSRGSSQSPNLINLISESFKSDEIEGYKCIKCSLRLYLEQFLPSELKADLSVLASAQSLDWQLPANHDPSDALLLDFFLQQYQDRDLDDDEFVRRVMAFKNCHNIKSEQSLQECRVTILRSKQILKPPKILCFHLNRLCYDSQGNLYINRERVSFDEYLSLELPSLNPHGFDLHYRLCSVVEHYGNAFGGHYVAARRISQPIEPEHKDKFLLCNDEHVYQIELKKVLQASPFMIFYEKIDSPNRKEILQESEVRAR